MVIVFALFIFFHRRFPKHVNYFFRMNILIQILSKDSNLVHCSAIYLNMRSDPKQRSKLGSLLIILF